MQHTGASLVRTRNDERRRGPDDVRRAWEVARVLSGLGGEAITFEAEPRAEMVAADAIAPAAVEWLWPDRIPQGMLTLFSGDPKLGKSLATLSLIAAVTRGGPLPGAGAGAGPAGPAMAPRGSA